MFTGLIGELGSITAIEKSESSAVFTISAPKLISQIAVGDSVAVNGVCLTATAISGNVFSADVMIQTLSLTHIFLPNQYVFVPIKLIKRICGVKRVQTNPAEYPVKVNIIFLDKLVKYCHIKERKKNHETRANL